MKAAIDGVKFQLYADDTIIYTSGHTAEEALNVLQPALNRFSNWCRINKLNVSKTKQMVFGTRYRVKRASQGKLTVNGLTLQRVPTYKYLGFTLDSTLTFNCHIRTMANMVNYKSILLAKIRKFLTEKVALKIYKSMILPYFD